MSTDSRSDWARPIVHWEITSPQPDVLRAFYAKLFNWHIEDGPVMRIGAGIGGPEPGPNGHIRADQQSGISLFVQVRSLRETLDKAASLGGAIVAEPFDLPGNPTLAAISDPDGNRVMLVQQ